MRLTALIPLTLLAACATQPDAPETSLAGQVDFLLVDKSDRTLTAYRDGQVLKTYTDVALGDAPEGHKQFEGDEKTPEGRYTIDTRNPNSAYHLSLRVSYPNSADRAHAEGAGQVPGRRYLYPWTAQPLAYGAFAGRLDRWLHRTVKCRDRGAVSSGGGRHPD